MLAVVNIEYTYTYNPVQIKIEINHEYDRFQIRMDRNREDKNELLTDKWSD